MESLFGSLRMGDDNHVFKVWNQRQLMPYSLTQPSLDPIPNHSISNLSSHRKSNATFRVLALREKNQHTGKTNSPTYTLNPLNFSGFPQSTITGKSQCAALAALRRYSGYQTLASLGSTTFYDVASTGGFHPSTETVGPFTLDVTGLIRALHLNLRAAI